MTIMEIEGIETQQHAGKENFMAECKVSQTGLCVTTMKQAEVKEGGSFSFPSTTCGAIGRTRPDGTSGAI